MVTGNSISQRTLSGKGVGGALQIIPSILK
jgi:hypothetical protein